MLSRYRLEVIFCFQILQLTVLPQKPTMDPPPPIQSCNDPLILSHVQDYSHSYCFHTCGFLQAMLITNASTLGQIALFLNNGQPFGDSADAYCNPAGQCVCQPACPLSTPRLQTALDTDLCPADNSISTPATPEILAACDTTCRIQCGFSGLKEARVCREVALLGDDNDIDTNICTCNCEESILSCFDFEDLLSRLPNILKGVKFLKFKLTMFKLWKKLVRICFFLLKVKLVKYYFMKLVGWLLTWAGLVELVSEGVWRGLEESAIMEGWGYEGAVTKFYY